MSMSLRLDKPEEYDALVKAAGWNPASVEPYQPDRHPAVKVFG